MFKILLLFVSVQNLYGLMCHSNGSFYFSRNTFNWNNISSTLFNIKNEFTTKNSVCHVRIAVDYNNVKNNYVIIKFDSQTNLNITHIEFGSTINLKKNEVQSVTSYLDYSCSSGNFCDRIFLNDWAKQLLSSNDNPLHSSFTSAWNKSSITPNACNSKQPKIECTSYLCFTIYEELKSLSYGKFQCIDESSTNPVSISIKTRGDNVNDYHCIKNHCTGEVLYDSIFGRNILDKSMINGMENLHKFNTLILIQTSIIVGVLLFIGCIAYYFQSRKFKQGYRLAANA